MNGEQGQRVDVAVRVGGQPHSEVDVRVGAFGLSAWADRPHDLSLRDCGPRSDRNRPEVDERDRVAVLGPDRQAATFSRQLAGEGDDAGRRGAHLCSRRRADVDATVLATRVRILLDDE
jgi:hypothetical protein